VRIIHKLNNRTTIDVEGVTQQEVFEALGSAGEVFAQNQCGNCQSENVRFNTRVHDNVRFFEVCCNDCGAALGFGQRKDGTGMFPKRWDKEAQCAIGKNGWKIYERPAASSSTGSRQRDF